MQERGVSSCQNSVLSFDHPLLQALAASACVEHTVTKTAALDQLVHKMEDVVATGKSSSSSAVRPPPVSPLLKRHAQGSPNANTKRHQQDLADEGIALYNAMDTQTRIDFMASLKS